MIDMDVEDQDHNITADPNLDATSATPARILEVVSFDDSPPASNDGGTFHAKKHKLSIVDKRKRMMRRNAISSFYIQGERSISLIFTTNNSPDQIKWKDISPHFRTKKKKKNHEDITNANTMRPTSSSPLTMSSSKAVTLNRPCSAKASFRPISNQYSQDFISEQSIWSSYPVMTMIEEFLKEETEIEADENMDELFEHWIKVFISTCHQHIKDIVLNTNNSISQHIDLNGSDLTNGHQNFIKVYTIPTWPQVRLLEDKSKQKYIALKKSHSLSWFVLPRECPKLNQQWVCYPINSMNTFENEFRITEENSIQRMLLRLLALKCFNKIHKNHIVPVNFDINNILLVSSTCGLIMIFKEDKNELDISTFNILKSENLEDIPKQWSIVRNEVKESVTKFFYRLNIISTLISSTWPVDYLAYMLAKLIVETDK